MSIIWLFQVHLTLNELINAMLTKTKQIVYLIDKRLFKEVGGPKRLQPSKIDDSYLEREHYHLGLVSRSGGALFKKIAK